ETPNDIRTDFVYDGRGRMRQRTESVWDGGGWEVFEEATYIYDGMRVIQERSSNTPSISYTRGSDLSGSLEGAGGIGGILSRSRGYSGGSSWSTHDYYFADGGGNITYIVDSSQSLSASYRYDPYGNVISTGGPNWAGNYYRFSSKEAHWLWGIYYF